MTDKKKSAPAEATPEPEVIDTGRYEYTGATEGHIVLGPQRAVDVVPGLVVKADDAEHAALLVGTGHFVPTRHRATKPDPEAPAAPADAPTHQEAQA